jgi:hypothetical protein
MIMTRSISKTISLTAAAFAVTMLAGAAIPGTVIPGGVTSAEARMGHYGHRHHGHHGYRRHFYGPVFAVAGGYGGGCYWMKQRAINTGSPYWWNRYNECVGY